MLLKNCTLFELIFFFKFFTKMYFLLYHTERVEEIGGGCQYHIIDKEEYTNSSDAYRMALVGSCYKCS